GERDLAQRFDLLAQRVHQLLGLGEVELQRLLPARLDHVGELHQIPLADLLLEVRHLQPRSLQRQLGLAAALADLAPLLARLAHLLVAAAQALLGLIVLGARPAQLVAQAFRVGEELAELLLRHLALRLQGRVALLALPNLALQLLAPRLPLGPLLEVPLQRAGHAFAPLSHRRRADLGAGHFRLNRFGPLSRLQELRLQRTQPRLPLAL